MPVLDENEMAMEAACGTLHLLFLSMGNCMGDGDDDRVLGFDALRLFGDYLLSRYYVFRELVRYFVV